MSMQVFGAFPNGEGATFYRWRMECHARKSQRNCRVAKYVKRSRGYQGREMPYEDSIANVGFWEEVESHIGLILKAVGEITKLAYKCGGVERAIRPFGESW